MSQKRRDFYAFHASLMEPWDGPACVTFTDGNQVGAVLDRNGLRPSRYWVTKDGLVVLASEVGVLDFAPADIVRKGRLQPGKMFLVDIEAGRIIEDDEIKDSLADSAPYGEWINEGMMKLSDLPSREHIVYPHSSVVRRQRAFGYTEEEIRIVLTPMAKNGMEALGSMGTDSPIAALSAKPRLLYDYFSQLFAQVTNPPIDPIRERLVMSLAGFMGNNGNILDEDKIITSSNNVYQISELQIYEGDYYQDSYIVNYDIETQYFLMTNKNIDISTVTVNVIENNGATNTEFTRAQTTC
jgi:glutamate synthase (NADPH/NADH) large chain